MATTGGQPGNTNGVKAKRWREAIMRALARSSGTVDNGLDAAADKLVSMAINDGDHWAIEHMADRIDGKARQEIEHAGDGGGPIKITVVRFGSSPIVDNTPQ